MANLYDQFDGQPTAFGMSTAAPASSSSPDSGQPAEANPFDKYDGEPTAFGGSTSTNSPTTNSDGTPVEPQASLTSIAKNYGVGLLAGVPNLATSVQRALTPPDLITEGKNWWNVVSNPDAWSFSGPTSPELQATIDQQRTNREASYGPAVGDALKSGMGMVGLNPDDPTQMPQPQNAPERIARAAGEGTSSGAVFPGEIVANTILGATSGLGSGVGRELAPEKYKDAAGLIGGLVGGGVGAVASEIPSAIASTASHATDYVGPLTQAGRENMAGKVLANSATDPDAAINAIATAPREIVPGSSPTTFQLTGDMGLGGLERAVAAKNPTAFNDLRGEQNAARLDALSNVQAEGHPEAVSSFFRDQLDQLDQSTQAAHDAAAASAQSATEKVGGSQPVDVSGEQTRTALQNNLDAAKANESALWKSVDPEGTMQTIATPIKQAYSGIYGNLGPEASIGLAPVERQIGDVISNYGQTLPLQRLVDLRSTVSQAMRDARSPLQANMPAYGRLSQLRGGIEDAISDTVAQKAAQEQQAVATGAMQPEDALAARMRQAVESWRNDRALEATGTGNSGIATGGTSPLSSQAGAKGQTGGGLGYGSSGADMSGGPLVDQATSDRLKAATAATASRKQVFGAKPVSQIIQRPGATMPYNMQPGSVASSVWKAGNGGADALGAVLKASPEAVGPIRDIAAASLRSKAPNGVIDSGHLERWKSQYAPALGALEKAAPGSTSVFETAAKAGDHLAEVAAQRKATLDAYQQSAVGKLLKADDPADVVKTVGGIFGRSDSVKTMRSVAQEAAKDPNAMAGLRKAIVEHMQNKLVSNTEAATSGRNLIKADAFQSFLAQNHAALSQVFNEGEIGSMRAIAQDLKRANRSITAAKLPGGSNTAQDLAAMNASNLHETLLSRLFTHVASVAAGVGGIGGLTGAVIGGWGAKALLGAREAGIKNVEDLIQRAMLDPDLAKTLLMKAPKRADTGSELTLANKLKRMAVMAPVIASDPSKDRNR